MTDYFYLLFDLVLIQYYGWVFFLLSLIYMLFWLKRSHNQDKYVLSTEWVFLEVKVDELSERSPFAMEQVFAALHAIHTTYNWGEKFNGRVILWLSCEIVSLGGKVSFIFKIPVRYRNLLESAIFAQYPKAEINEIEDYLKNLPHFYDPDKVNFEFWGTQLAKKKSSAYPIRTYGSYEHTEQETIIDPLSNVLEVMSNLQPHELLVAQIVIRPIADDDWKPHIQHLLDKLKGAPPSHETGWFQTIFLSIPGAILGGLLDIFSTTPEGPPPRPPQPEPPSQMLHKTEGEKQVIAAIEHMITKPSYETRIRLLYLAPKDKFNKSLRVPEIIGGYRNFTDTALNTLKPDVSHTWTDPAYKISEKLEAPYVRKNTLTRKRHFWHNFLPRSYWRGFGYMIMNTEELATLFHFPQAPNVRVSQIQKVQTVKSAPPANLPVG